MTDAAPTPRTDAVVMEYRSTHKRRPPHLWVDLARQLERDLAAAEAREKRLRGGASTTV